MSLKLIKKQSLNLTEDERAALAQKLLFIANDWWLAEAYRRARELDEGFVKPIPAEEVRRKAEALLR